MNFIQLHTKVVSEIKNPPPSSKPSWIPIAIIIVIAIIAFILILVFGGPRTTYWLNTLSLPENKISAV